MTKKPIEKTILNYNVSVNEKGVIVHHLVFDGDVEELKCLLHQLKEMQGL